MAVMATGAAYLLLVAFAVTMFLATTILSRGHRWQTTVGFMAAGRNVNWVLGSVSIAVCWIWAPALFVSVQEAYQQGVPGIFWFTFPNALCLVIVAPLAVRIRRYLPGGYTQPEWIRQRFDEKTHKMYLIPFFWYQLMAVTVQLYAGGSIFSLLTGARVEFVMVVLAGTTLAYGLISGMRASIITDFLQYALVVAGGLIVIPWAVAAAGGFSAVVGGLGGQSGTHRSIFDPQVAFNFGIVQTIGLISGMLADQQHWQRAFTIKTRDLVRSYVVGGLLFGIVPLSLGLLGFIGANPRLGITLPKGVDASMIGVAVITHYLPGWAVIAFLLMLLGGLCSTLDSGLVAAASLFAINCFRYTKSEELIARKERLGDELTALESSARADLDRKILYRGRAGMIGITVAGLLVAFAVLYIPGFGLQYLWWIFNTVAACIAVPTVLSLYWPRLSSRGVFWGVITAFCCGVPVFVYSNIKNIPWLTVASSVGIVLITLLFAFAFPKKEDFHLGPPGNEITAASES